MCASCANPRCRNNFIGTRRKVYCSSACRNAHWQKENRVSPVVSKVEFYEKLLIDVVFSPEKLS